MLIWIGNPSLSGCWPQCCSFTADAWTAVTPCGEDWYDRSFVSLSLAVCTKTSQSLFFLVNNSRYDVTDVTVHLRGKEPSVWWWQWLSHSLLFVLFSFLNVLLFFIFLPLLLLIRSFIFGLSFVPYNRRRVSFWLSWKRNSVLNLLKQSKTLKKCFYHCIF